MVTSLALVNLRFPTFTLALKLSIMPSRLSVPRIRVDFLDGSPRSLSPSGTLDIRDILSQAKLFPNLFSERLAFDDADDALYLDDRYLQDVPPFPIGRQPPLFILLSHRTRLPFHIRTETFEFGDFLFNEDHLHPLLTAPTIPRMKLMMKEQMYVQKWVDSLTLDNPPKHIPWTCEKPAAGRDWFAQGSLFPVAVVRSLIEQHGLAQERSLAPDTNGSSGLPDQTPHSGDLCTVTEASAPYPRSPTSHVPVTSTDAPSHASCRIARQLQAPSPPIGPAIVNPDAPLVTRRGKSLSGLKLKENGSVIEQLEYPDIPTAFLGSPSVWSPRFDPSVVPSFTNHETMISNLTSKSAALVTGVPICIEETLRPQSETAHSTLGIDEWAFARGLATFENNSSGSNNVSGIVDTNTFFPCDFSTPTKRHGLTPRLGFAPPHSTPTVQFPMKSPYDPPADPLPPRPALVSPSTPPHVRGILKKVKSVRFEDVIIAGLKNHALPVDPLPHASPEPPSPSPVAASSETSCKPTPTKADSGTLAPTSEMPRSEGVIEEKRPAPRPRLPRRTKTNGQIELARSNVVNTPESSKPTVAASLLQRPCRVAHAKENSNPAGVARGHVKQKGSMMDMRRGFEGPTKSRLSVPLRNIFRFK